VSFDLSFANFSAQRQFLSFRSLDKERAQIYGQIATQLENCGIEVLAMENDRELACLKYHDSLFSQAVHPFLKRSLKL
jgi:hypothetical protein